MITMWLSGTMTENVWRGGALKYVGGQCIPLVGYLRAWRSEMAKSWHRTEGKRA